MVHECTHTLLNSFFEKNIWIEFVTLGHRASLALSTVDDLYLTKVSVRTVLHMTVLVQSGTYVQGTFCPNGFH